MSSLQTSSLFTETRAACARKQQPIDESGENLATDGAACSPLICEDFVAQIEEHKRYVIAKRQRVDAKAQLRQRSEKSLAEEAKKRKPTNRAFKTLLDRPPSHVQKIERVERCKCDDRGAIHAIADNREHAIAQNRIVERSVDLKKAAAYILPNAAAVQHTNREKSVKC